MVKFVEQIEPFIKTPTKKIKRFLYIENEKYKELITGKEHK